MAGMAPPLNMESLLELQRVAHDIFVTAESPWLPPGAPSIYGGTVVAHCMLAAHATVPSGSVISSLHGAFVQGGKPNIPIYYTVQKLQSDNFWSVCTVRAVQEGQCIFLATINFRPEERSELPKSFTKDRVQTEKHLGTIKGGGGAEICPYICSELGAAADGSGRVHETKVFQWMKTRHSIKSDQPPVHLAAIAYMSDNYFLPTATRVHGLRWERDPENLPPSLAVEGRYGDIIKMMVLLDHKIYFHHCSEPIRADEWLRSEMQSPWAGEGRALVSQKILSGKGELIATVLQEPRVCFDFMNRKGPGFEQIRRAGDAGECPVDLEPEEVLNACEGAVFVNALTAGVPRNVMLRDSALRRYQRRDIASTGYTSLVRW